MGSAARAVATVSLVVIGAAAAGAGLLLASPQDREANSPYLTETVAKGVVSKTVSDTGLIADRYTYSIRPEADPELVAVHGVEQNGGDSQGTSGSTTGSTSSSDSESETYTLDSLKVKPGDRVEKDDVLAVVLDSNDEEIEVKSPLGGVVRSVNSAKQSEITEIATLGVGRTEVVFEVSEYDVVRLKNDQNVQLTLDSDGSKFEGTIAEIAQGANTSEDTGRQTFQVIARTANLPKSTKIGMSTSVKIIIESSDDVLSVPLTAVTDEAGETTVRIQRADGTVEAQPVTTGLVGDTRVEITKGLRAGDTVILGDAAPSGAAPAGPFDGPPDSQAGPETQGSNGDGQ